MNSLRSDLAFKAPEVRFPEFKENWEEHRIDSLLKRIAIPIDVEQDQVYREIGIRSHGKGIFYKEPVSGETIGNKRVFEVVEDTFIVNIVFAWEQAVSRTTTNERGMIASHRFPMYRPKCGKSDVEFVRRYFLTPRGKYLLGIASPGGAGRNKTLGQKAFEELKVQFPKVDEQTKIANFLAVLDQHIQGLTDKEELLRQYKKGVMQKLLSKETRFTRDDGSNFPDWEEKELGEVLSYKQPTPYLVGSTEYSDVAGTPVLTAGKSFVLGFTHETKGIYETSLPAIIFDDFTTAARLVDFPFKVKSSAIKILTAIGDNDVRLLFELLYKIQYKPTDHKRHWISEFQYFTIQVPDPEEQQKIVEFTSSLDEKINAVSNQLTAAQTFKKGLLQKMFV